MKRWVHILAACLASMAGLAHAASLGVHPFQVDDPLRHVRFDALLWYPTDLPARDLQLGPFTLRASRDAPPRTGRYPLIVISHGSGGNALGHRDLAAALVSRGYAVLTFTHPFDNHANQSALGTTQEFTDRPLELRWAVDAALSQPLLRNHLDATRIGAAGFSMGGYTVLTAAGAKPDLTRYLRYCATQPDSVLICEAARHGGLRVITPTPPPARDPRLKAMVLMAPAAVFLFDDAALSGLHLPTLLYRAAQDRIVQEPDHAERLAKHLPMLDSLTAIPGAGHYIFLAPCPSSLADRLPVLCRDAPGIDRIAIHATLNRRIADFFDKTLQPGQNGSQ